MRTKNKRKKSLRRSGGACRLSGDSGLASILARCLDVDPEAKLRFTHGFHAYPARMHPDIAERVLEAFPATRVLDPFVGSGTTALEAVRRGLRFTGFDISRVALEIAWIRTRVLPPEQCRRVEVAGHRLTRRAAVEVRRPFPLPAWAEAEREWHSPHTLREICLLKTLIDGEEDAALRRMLTCVLSSLIVKLSRQASDASARPDPAFRPRPAGATFRMFGDKCTELTKNLLQMSSDLYKRKVPFVDPDLRLADARSTALPAGSVDLILTSPPYAGVYDYVRQQGRRWPLFGDRVFAEAHEMGSRRDGARRYRDDLVACLKNMLEALAPEGRILMLIGDGMIGDQRVRADVLIGTLAQEVRARLAARASQRRPGGEEHLLLLAPLR